MLVNRPSKGRIIVFGIYFWYPLAGVTYQFLHYMLGLKRLGYDPYYIEGSGRWIYDPKISDMSPDASGNVNAVAPILDAHGFKGRWAFRGKYEGGRCFGMTEEEILRLYREADAFLNVCGAQEIRDEHMVCKRRIYVETDPVAAQVKLHHGDEETRATLAAHDTHFSFGENFYAPDCKVPLNSFVKWKPTRQPVVLDLWNRTGDGGGEAYNTISTWRNKGKDIVFNGETYAWSKHHEFMKIIDLPLRRKVPFELASGVDDDVQALLHSNGWRIREPVGVSRDPAIYHDYILNSRGEFTVAKDQNIRLRSGWFSDRSACYLAASRPVINQDTAFGNVLPTGKGLFSFKTMDDILAAVDTIEADYQGNCRAARAVAEEYFDATKVLGSLMERAGL